MAFVGAGDGKVNGEGLAGSDGLLAGNSMENNILRLDADGDVNGRAGNGVLDVILIHIRKGGYGGKEVIGRCFFRNNGEFDGRDNAGRAESFVAAVSADPDGIIVRSGDLDRMAKIVSLFENFAVGDGADGEESVVKGKLDIKLAGSIVAGDAELNGEGLAGNEVGLARDSIDENALGRCGNGDARAGGGVLDRGSDALADLEHGEFIDVGIELDHGINRNILQDLEGTGKHGAGRIEAAAFGIEDHAGRGNDRALHAALFGECRTACTLNGKQDIALFDGTSTNSSFSLS